MPALLPISRRRPRRTAGAARGFTLVELLTATAVLGFMMALLFGVVGQVTQLWVREESHANARQNFRAIAQVLGRELQAALLPVNPQDPASLQFVLNPSAISADYRNPSALFWQAPVSGAGSAGDIAIIGYFVRWDTSPAGTPRARLCRYLVNPDDTTHYKIVTAPTAWLSNGFLDAVAPATEDHDYRGLIAEDVIGLWAIAEHRDASGNFVRYDAYDSRAAGKLPARITLHFALLDPGAASRLTAADKAAITSLYGQPKDFVPEDFVKNLPSSIQKAARIYTTQVYLKNAR